MAQIAYLLLCHQAPDAIIAQAQALTAVGDAVAIHFDARAAQADYAMMRAALDENPKVAFVDDRLRCGWGQWSLVAATLKTARKALDAFPEASHFYLISGDCMPIKSAEHIRAALDAEDKDQIEMLDFATTDWIKTGWKEERLIYRHWFNERRQRAAFYGMYYLQKWLGLTRTAPPDLTMKIGTQWWCLRRSTLRAVLAFAADRPDVVRFFRQAWIPDEVFFQTVVAHLIPTAEIAPKSPTFTMFSDYGMPVTVHGDHHDLLLGLRHHFARKVAPDAAALRTALGALYATTGQRFEAAQEGRALYSFLTGRGRIGRRFAPRMWEAEATLGAERELLIAICRKWSLGKRLAGLVRNTTGIATVDYIFDETDCPLPDLGGIESSLVKRHRHRRAVLRMVFDRFQTDRLLICVDPESLSVLEDFDSDAALVRMIEIDCHLDDAWLAGHAERVGLTERGARPEALDRVLPALRAAQRHASDRLRDARFRHFSRLREGAPLAANQDALRAFLSVDAATARAILPNDQFFDEGDGA